MKDKVKRIIYSIKFRIAMLCVLFAVVVITSVTYSMWHSTSDAMINMVENMLESDINYVQDYIGADMDAKERPFATWNVSDGNIYYGSVLIGDGTEEKANIDPFLAIEKKTGTFSYVFMRTYNDDELGTVPSTPTQEGYKQGHYLRIAGSTKNPDGKSIVGTYIEKSIADSLDKKGEYVGESNVDGGIIYCIYKALVNSDGQTVGAMVVGRNVSELDGVIRESVGRSSAIIFFAVAILIIFIIVGLSSWTKSLRKVDSYLREIQDGYIPEAPLPEKGDAEISDLYKSVNSVMESLKGKPTMFKEKNETDEMTGLMNKAGIGRVSMEFFEYCKKEQKPFGIEIIDIDSFAKYNEAYGREAGDSCIREIADALSSIESENVAVARYGTGEFTILYRGMSKEDIDEYMEKIKNLINEKNIKHEYSGTSGIVTVSQGVSLGVPSEESRIGDYLIKADEALYSVKKRGKNGYRAFVMF